MQKTTIKVSKEVLKKVKEFKQLVGANSLEMAVEIAVHTSKNIFDEEKLILSLGEMSRAIERLEERVDAFEIAFKIVGVLKK